MENIEEKQKAAPYHARKDYIKNYNKRLYAGQRLFRKLAILFVNNERSILNEDKQSFVNSLDDLEQQVFYDWLKKIQNPS